MGSINVLEGLFDEKKMRVINAFMAAQSKQFYLMELAKTANVPPATTFRALQKLISMGIVKEVNISRFKLYQWADNEKTKFIEQVFRQDLHLLSLFIDEIKGIEGVQMVVQHGKEQADKANVLVIGDFINSEELKKAVLKIGEKYKFKISYLTLTEEQYHQMLSMGLYTGQKKVLYDARGLQE